MNIDTNQLLEEGDAHFKNGQLIKAEETYKKIINHKPNHIQAHNNLGVTLQKLGKLKEAELIYKKTIELNPCLLYTSPSPRDRQKSRMPSSA